MMDEKFGWNDGERLAQWTKWRLEINWTHAYSSINLINWPTARIDHRAAGTIQLTTKIWIANVHIEWQRIASVQFHIVHFPVGKQLSILLRKADNAWIAGARVIAEILVNAEFQATRMNLIDWQSEISKKKNTFIFHEFKRNSHVRPTLSFHAGSAFDRPPIHLGCRVFFPTSSRLRWCTRSQHLHILPIQPNRPWYGTSFRWKMKEMKKQKWNYTFLFLYSNECWKKQ